MSHNELPLFYVFHFYLFGIIAIASAVAFVTRKSPVAAALWLVNTMFSLAAMYVLLDAHFIGVIQVLVYAGAITVVFLFVIMLLNLGSPQFLREPPDVLKKAIGFLLAFVLFTLIGSQVLQPLANVTKTTSPDNYGSPQAVGIALFTTYVWPFEVASVLLLIGIVGSILLAKRKI